MIEFSAQEKRIVIFLLTSFLIGLCVAYYRSKTSAQDIKKWQELQKERMQTFAAIEPNATSELTKANADAEPLQATNKVRKEALLKKININKASSEQLQTLDRIGPVLAERIILHREKNGMFKSIDDLLLVPGIGPKTLDRIKTKICVGDSIIK